MVGLMTAVWVVANIAASIKARNITRLAREQSSIRQTIVNTMATDASTSWYRSNT